MRFTLDRHWEFVHSYTLWVFTDDELLPDKRHWRLEVPHDGSPPCVMCVQRSDSQPYWNFDLVHDEAIVMELMMRATT